MFNFNIISFAYGKIVFKEVYIYFILYQRNNIKEIIFLTLFFFLKGFYTFILMFVDLYDIYASFDIFSLFL